MSGNHSPTPISESIERKEKNIKNPTEVVNFFLFRLPEDDESICLALHLTATLDFKASFNIGGYKN